MAETTETGPGLGDLLMLMLFVRWLTLEIYSRSDMQLEVSIFPSMGKGVGTEYSVGRALRRSSLIPVRYRCVEYCILHTNAVTNAVRNQTADSLTRILPLMLCYTRVSFIGDVGSLNTNWYKRSLVFTGPEEYPKEDCPQTSLAYWLPQSAVVSSHSRYTSPPETKVESVAHNLHPQPLPLQHISFPQVYLFLPLLQISRLSDQICATKYP